MATQFDTDVPVGKPTVPDTAALSDAEVSRAITSCEAARDGRDRRFNTQLGRAYASRAVRLASPEHDAEARDLMKKAIGQWTEADAKGSGAAMNFLGAVYRGSFNLPNFSFETPDYPKALSYWLRGDTAGNIKAARNAGGLLLLGGVDYRGVEQNFTKARELLNKAIIGGDVTAASLYGQALFYDYPTGIAVGSKSAAQVEGHKLLKDACSRGDPAAAAFFTTEMAKTKKSPLISTVRPPGC